VTTAWSRPAPADDALVRRLERAALRAVPAESEWEVRGWLCRWGAGGLVGRVASAAVSPYADPADLAPASEVAASYGARGLPPLLRVTPLTPPDLLGEPGLRETRSPVLVMARGLEGPHGDGPQRRADGLGASVAESATVAGSGAADAEPSGSASPLEGGAAVALSEDVPDAWRAAFLEHHTSAEGPPRLALAAAAPLPRRFAVAALDGAVAGLGLGVVADGTLGVFDVLTVPQRRRRGVATAVVRALLAWGRVAGADLAYLQVAAANASAVALYERLGFRRAYAYSYATVSSAASPSPSPA